MSETGLPAGPPGMDAGLQPRDTSQGVSRGGTAKLKIRREADFYPRKG
jgi:hypothetical protein